MYRNGYGWLTFASPGTQLAGFYVNEDDKIVYWPKWRGNGYILDEDTAIDLYLSIASLREKSLFFIKLYAIITIALFTVFSGTESLVLVLFKLVMGFITAIRFIGYKYDLKENPVLNEIKLHSEPDKILSGRPWPELIKNSEETGKVKWVFSAIVFISIFALFFWMAIGINKLGFYFLTAFLFVIAAYTVLREIYGVRISDIKFYQADKEFTYHQDRYNLRYGVLEETAVISEAKWFWYKKRLFLKLWPIFVLLLMIPLGTFLYEKYTRPHLTAEYIVESYENIVLSQMRISKQLPFVVKWQKPITLNISGFETDPLQLELMEEFQKFAAMAGLTVNFSDVADFKNGLTVRFLVQTNKNKVGKFTPFSFILTHINGDIKRGRLKLSPSAFEEKYKVSLSDHDSARRLFIENSIMRSLGFFRPTFITNESYRDASFNELKLKHVLLALHHDSRIKTGMSPMVVKPIVKEIAMEIEQARSFEDWLKSRQPNTLAE